MLIEIPTPAEYADASLSHLHLAWTIAADVLKDFAEADMGDGLPDGEVAETYWRQVQPALANAFNLVQQAQELALKGRIADVSPYLLISRDVRDWPRRCDKRDVPFSDFRTADAADLIRLHDTVAATRLPPAFAAFYDDVRRRRNVLMHQGLPSTPIAITDLLLMVLKAHQFLFDGGWAPARLEQWSSGSLATLYSSDFSVDAALAEFELVVSFLPPAPLKAYLGFDKKARRYLCPNCQRQTDAFHERVALAQLRAPAKESTQLYCFACDKEQSVQRVRCSEDGCNSNVLTDEVSGERTCLVCWSDGQ